MNLAATADASAERPVRVSLPKITIAMMLCGIVSAAGIGAASAAVPDDDVQSVVVKYQPASLLTDIGAHSVYRRIVAAAEQVCPQSAGSRLISPIVQQCRAQAIARAVVKINDPRLAAVHDGASRKG